MRWLRTLVLFDKGGVVASSDWKAVHTAFVRAIQRIEHPADSGKLTLRRKKYDRKSKQWDRNGVTPLKAQFFRSMVENEGWQAEAQFDIAGLREATNLQLYPSRAPYREPVTSEFGKFDFVTTAPSGTHVAIEWETGNISSSHRSLNKLAIALGAGKIHAGVLILPSRDLYEHLTDRIGNIGELSPYLAMWSGLASTVERGLLALAVVEHDELTDDEAIPYLKAGKDGRSKEGKRKRKSASKSAGTKRVTSKTPS